MEWFASFKGLRAVGLPPVVAGLAIAAAFAYKKFVVDGSDTADQMEQAASEPAAA